MNDSIITEFDEQTGEWEIVDADMDAMIDRILKPGDGPTVECETIEQRVARQEQLRRIAEMDYQTYLNAVVEQRSWIPYEGPRGGQGWKSSKTGRIVYQKDPPGEREHHGDDDLDKVGRLSPELKNKVKRVDSGKGGEAKLSLSELDELLRHGIVGFVSAGRNPQSEDDVSMSDEQVAERYSKLRSDLIDAGYRFVPVRGKYGDEEDSFMVVVPEVNRDDILDLGRRYNQDSVLWSRAGQNEMVFTTGSNEGMAVVGTGFGYRDDAQDFYTEFCESPNENCRRFTMGLNFDAPLSDVDKVRDSMARIEDRYPPVEQYGSETQAKYKTADGYTPERTELHGSIVSSIVRGAKKSSDPTVTVLGGGTASGKTTVASRHVNLPEGYVHLDPDHIKEHLPEFGAMTDAKDHRAAGFVHEESSDISKMVIKSTYDLRADMLYDATGNSSIDNLSQKVKAMRDTGYKVRAHYVTVDTDSAVSRATSRANRTGRYVDEEIIRDLHAGVSKIFPQAVERGLFDEFSLWDNNGTDAVLVASGKGSNMKIHDPELYRRFLSKATSTR